MSLASLPGVEGGYGVRGRHVLYAVLAFFAVVFAVNGVMLYLALATHSGIVAQEPYRKGLAYNDRIAADERQADLQWTADAALTRSGTIAVSLKDAAGGPVAGRIVEVTLGRAASSRHDMLVRLAETEVPGRYVATVRPIEPGTWVVDAVVRETTSAASPVYRMRRRLWLKP